jgi:hypothetical protein
MISYEDGERVNQMLLAARANTGAGAGAGAGAGSGIINDSFLSEARVGEFAAIDHNGFLAEVGDQDPLHHSHTYRYPQNLRPSRA